MRCRLLLAFALLALSAGKVEVQLIISTTGPAFSGFNSYSSSALFSTRLGHSGRLSLGFNSIGVNAWGGPGFFGPGLLGPGFFGGYSQTTIIFGPPVVYYPVPVLVPAVAVGGDQGAFDRLPGNALVQGDMGPGVERLRPLPDRIVPDRPRAAFRDPAPPERRAPAPAPKPEAPRPEPQPKQPQPPPKPPPQPPPPPPPPAPPPMPPQPPAPEKDPLDESARQVELGKQVFAARSYGKAAQHFRLALRVAPNQPQAHFLLAQALLALGKYPEAVDAIHAGMVLQPDWPTARFRPLDLYGPNVADYPEHLRRLEEVVQANPNDPLLLFLYAYELWFDGRREEARVWLKKVLPGAPHPELIQRFLRALPQAPVL